MTRLVGILLAIQVTACATVAHRPIERITIQSNPPGADAVIDCAGGVKASGVTPASIGIPRHAEGCVLSISKEGMLPQKIQLQRAVSGKYWGALWTAAGAVAALALMASYEDGLEYGAILLGPPLVYGLTSAAIDASTGRRWLHEPDEIDVKLEPLK
jgi:hypothetical protein